MTSVRKVFDLVRSLRDLRRALRPHPSHFRRLIVSFALNATRLATLKLRGRLLGRKLIVIGLAERMGDIVACEPGAQRLRSQYPEDVILWAMRPAYVDLMKNDPNIDIIIKIYCITEWIWMRKIRLCDYLCDFHVNEKFCEECCRPLIKNDGDPEININNYYNYGSLLTSFSRSAGMPMEDGVPMICVDRESERAVDRLDLPPRYITIHATSAEDSRNWEEGKWRELVDHINLVYKLAVVEIGQRSFFEKADGDNYRNLCSKCGLLETAEVIRRSILFIGIDSGPAHLANAVQTRGLILLGSYRSFGRYMPYSGFYSDPANCCILHHEGPASGIPIDLCVAAIDEIARSFQKSP